ncbi:MAG: FAD-dependent oxidoreductase [Emcibacteraceae bacterium]
MTKIIKADICIIGGGSGGLSVAAGAAQLGKNTVLIEGGKMGGDCLNYGCVPSKSLLAAAQAAQSFRNVGAFGIKATDPDINFSKTHDYVHNVIAGIAPHDSIERFEGLGVTVIPEYGSFIDHKTIKAGDNIIKAKRFVIATGSSPSIPPISGLDKTDYLTNETIFDLKEAPEHLIIIGGGPVGLEMAQAHKRLGSKVTVIALDFMENDDPELVKILLKSLSDEGIDFREKVTIKKINGGQGQISVTLENEIINGTHLLIATGRRANIDRLDLEKAGIEYNRQGIIVGANLRTSNKAVYAIGDVTGGPGFTHKAGYDAGIIIRRIIFGMFWAKTDYKALPHTTYTSPTLAGVGLREAEAREKFGENIKILRWSYNDNDRAKATGTTNGLVKVITSKNGKILGASIVGTAADELLAIWILAIEQGIKISAIANMIYPYPTLGEINKRAASSFYTASLFSDKTKMIVRILSFLG